VSRFDEIFNEYRDDIVVICNFCTRDAYKKTAICLCLFPVFAHGIFPGESTVNEYLYHYRGSFLCVCKESLTRCRLSNLLHLCCIFFRPGKEVTKRKTVNV